MTIGGFAGAILHVDLTRREVRREPLDPFLAEAFIGGLGLLPREFSDVRVHLTVTYFLKVLQTRPPTPMGCPTTGSHAWR